MSSILPEKFTPLDFIGQTNLGSLFHGCYLGIALAVILINLIYAIRLRDRLYGYFALFVLSLLSAYLGLERLLFTILPGVAHLISDYVVGAGIGASFVFISLFSARLFNTAEQAPASHRFFQITGLFGLMLMLSVPLGMYGHVARAISLWGLSLIVLLTAMSIGLVRRGEVAGKIYLLAFTASNVGYAVTFFRVLKLAPVTWFTLHALQLGSVLNMVMMSLALTERLRDA